MNRSGTPLGVFQDGRLIEVAPDDLTKAYELRDRLADEHGVRRDQYEVLRQCPTHPYVSLVDCLDCEPI